MSIEDTPKPVVVTPETEATPEPASSEPGLSNSDVKSHPLFKKLTSQLSEMNSKFEQRETAEKAEKTAAEQAKLLEEKNFTELLTVKENEFKAKLAELEQANAEKEKLITKKDLTIALTGKGFQNETFLDGAVARYNAEKHGDFTAYADALASDESNAALLNAAVAKSKVPDVRVPTTPTATMTPKELKAMLHHKDLEKRAAAREIVSANWIATGSSGVEG